MILLFNGLALLLKQGANMMHCKGYSVCVEFIHKIILDNQSIKLIYCHFFNMHLFFRVNETNTWIHPAVSERGTNMYLARANVSYHTAVQAWICWGEFNPSTTALVAVLYGELITSLSFLNYISFPSQIPPRSLLGPPFLKWAWRKKPLSKQCYRRGLNPRPPDPEFEVLTICHKLIASSLFGHGPNRVMEMASFDVKV